jgi:hypothetical protein
VSKGESKSNSLKNKKMKNDKMNGERKMKIIEKTTGKTVAEIIGGSNLTLDQVLDLIGAVNVDDMDNDLYSNDGDNIITADGKRWWYDDLDYIAD